MAVEHIVWLKFKPGVTSERIAEHLANLQSLTDRVPGIAGFRIGENFTDRADGYTHGFIVTFRSRKELEAYLPHPEHQAVAKPLVADAQVLAMDFEC